jgi:hypothetical protein
MPEETATLRDTVVNDAQAVTEKEVTEPELKAPQIVDQPSAEAAELGRLMLESGISKDQLNALLEAPKALDAIRYQIKEDPKEFIRMLERTDPDTGSKFLAEVSDMFLDRNKHLLKDDAGKAQKADSQHSDELMREVERLREQTTRLLTEEQQRKQSASLAAVRQRYDARVDDLFGLKEVKEMDLKPSEVKNLRARLNLELSGDQSAVQRVNNGNFVDVPRVFQSLLNEKVDDRKAAADLEKGKRERVNSNAFWDFSNGPDASFLGDLNKIISDDNDPNWGGTVDGFAKALERTGR